MEKGRTIDAGNFGFSIDVSDRVLVVEGAGRVIRQFRGCRRRSRTRDVDEIVSQSGAADAGYKVGSGSVERRGRRNRTPEIKMRPRFHFPINLRLSLLMLLLLMLLVWLFLLLLLLLLN